MCYRTSQAAKFLLPRSHLNSRGIQPELTVVNQWTTEDIMFPLTFNSNGLLRYRSDFVSYGSVRTQSVWCELEFLSLQEKEIC